MNKPLLPLFALALTSTLAGCTEPASPGAQAALTLSNSVQLSAAGKTTAPEKITPVRITFPDSRSYAAVPPAFQPKTCQLSSSHFTAEVALLRKGQEAQTSPFPRRTYPTGSVT
ncbi:hypothetical protein KBY28_20380, partial [Ruegeria pomeroyi]|nr:hypothetical protein [Ruegeria pomeroyi]